MRRLTVVSSATLVAFLSASSVAFAQTGPATSAVAGPPANADTSPNSDIIVTGTRKTGVTAAESPAPIKLVGQDAISHVGQPNLNQVLTQLVPSFTAQSVGVDAANNNLTAALRGLNPNETLVLVNGKRRHGTASLNVVASPFQGGASPDLDYITPASIDHVEVLEDGASAQYGSDAIAGVINIILKSKAGGTFSATGGQYYAGDGETYSTSLNYGLVGSRGFINVTGFYRFHDYSQRGKYDVRALDPETGALPAGIAQYRTLAQDYLAMPGYPNVDRGLGDSRSRFGVGSYNAGYHLTDEIQVYSFGSVGFRHAKSFEFTRFPDRILATGTPGVAGTVDQYDDDVVNHPNYIFSRSGVNPQEGVRALDYSAAGGVKGSIGSWKWDLSTTYGKDRERVSTLDSANADLFIDTLTSRTNFYDGEFSASEWTTDLDITRTIGTIATLAVGAEYRRNTYDIAAGDPSSYYKTGAQSFPGYSPSSAGKHSRHNSAVYVDLALTPFAKLKLDGAVRHEHYSDFGSKVTWKGTGRYDFTPEVAIRGTAATGFRAPTLAEEYYTQVNVSTNSAFVQLAANSDAAKVLGIQNLRPEKSTNYSLGIVLRPTPRFIVTFDAYQIRIQDRIVGSAAINTSSDTFDLADPVFRAISRSGYSLEALDSIGIESFVNGPTTRTRGVDVVASYDADLSKLGRATFTVSGAYNTTKITRPGVNPSIIGSAPVNQSLFDQQLTSFLTTASPRLKIISGVNWTIGDISIVGRETFYSSSHAYLNDGSGIYTYTRASSAGLTDLEADYHLTKSITLALGANNLFDNRQNVEPYIGGETASGALIYKPPLMYSPYGIMVDIIYGRVDVRF